MDVSHVTSLAIYVPDCLTSILFSISLLSTYITKLNRMGHKGSLCLPGPFDIEMIELEIPQKEQKKRQKINSCVFFCKGACYLKRINTQGMINAKLLEKYDLIKIGYRVPRLNQDLMSSHDKEHPFL